MNVRFSSHMSILSVHFLNAQRMLKITIRRDIVEICVLAANAQMNVYRPRK